MTTLDHQLIAAAGIRDAAANLARILLAALAAVMWALGYAPAATIRATIRVARWSAAAVSLGWRDAWSPEADR